MLKRRWMNVMALIVALVMTAVTAAGLTSCGSRSEEPETEPEQEQEEKMTQWEGLSEEDVKSILWQISDQEVKLQHQEQIPDEGFAEAEIFGVDKDGDEGTMYAYLAQGEYVIVDGAAYNISGGAGEVIIRFEYTDEEPRLKRVVWSADGDGHEAWLKEKYPEEYLKKALAYDPFDKDGNNLLFQRIDKEVEEEMGAPVDNDNILEINDEKGTYKILKVVESGDPADDTYKFDTEVVKEGKLEDLE